RRRRTPSHAEAYAGERMFVAGDLAFCGLIPDTRVSVSFSERGAERMGFLDKLLGRGKQAAGEAADMGKKVASEAQDMGEKAYERGKDMLDRDDKPAESGSGGAAASTPPAAS